MSGPNVEAKSQPADTKGYERSRLNAVRHGILSQHLVLPWEDRSEFDDVLESSVAEHRPDGPTERHLVEELAGVMWRKQRLTMAEASAYRAGLHRALEKNRWDDDDRVPVRALAHLDVEKPTEDTAAAVRATPQDTEAELRDLAEDKAMTERALTILQKGNADACSKALAALHEDTLAAWSEMLAEADAKDLDDAEYDGDDETETYEPCQPDAQSLQRFLENDVVPWYATRRRELENRHLIRAQVFGEALEPHRLDFDEDFQGWGVDDLEWGFRISASGTPIILRDDVFAIHLPHVRDAAANRRTELANFRRFLAKWPRSDVELVHCFGDVAANSLYLEFEGELRVVAAGGRLGTLRGLMDGKHVVVVGVALDAQRRVVDERLIAKLDPGRPVEILPLAGLALPYQDEAVDECLVLEPALRFSDRYRDAICAEAERVSKAVVLSSRPPCD